MASFTEWRQKHFYKKTGKPPRHTTRAGTSTAGVTDNLGVIVVNNTNPYFRMRAIYVNTAAGVTVTFYSRAISVSLPRGVADFGIEQGGRENCAQRNGFRRFWSAALRGGDGRQRLFRWRHRVGRRYTLLFGGEFTCFRFDFNQPFYGFASHDSPNFNSNRVRVAGIVSGAVSVAANGVTLSVFIGDLTNILEQKVQAHELSYQWQTQAGVNWADVATGGAAQTYTAAAGATVRAIATDRAGMAAAQTATVTVATAAPSSALPEGSVRLVQRFGGSPVASNQRYNGAINITNGVDCGDDSFDLQRAEEGGGFPPPPLRRRRISVSS